MMHGIASFLLLSLTIPSFAAPEPAAVDHKALFRLWERAKTPLPGKSEAIGSYSAGCLAGAEKLPVDGPGYSVMRLSRSRYYGHPNLIRYLENLSATTKKAGLKNLLIGDLGRPRGGPMISGHASHQVGLDVDIWYRLSDKRPTKKERETWSASNLVTKEGRVGKGWGPDQRKLVELAAQDENVERIFVHAAIKKDLCVAYKDAAWLYKLRPWWNHADHLHVRLKCPGGSEQCTKQEPLVASNTGCGSEIDWWFSQEAKDEWAKKQASHGREFPVLPSSCENLVTEFAHNKDGQ